MKNQSRGYVTLTIILAVILLFGMLLIVLSYTPPLNNTQATNLGSDIAREIGIALVIASFLGASVEIFLRRQLAVDAFKATIGYLLPEELKGEMEWIYSTHILCVEHTQTCELSPIDDKMCAFYVKTIRKFRNISGSKESFPLSTSVDEWFCEAHPSRIISFGYSKLGTKRESFETVKNIHSISTKPQYVDLAPLEEIVEWFETEEILPRNGE